MSLTIPGRIVVFDYGEVISKSQSERDREELVAISGIEPERFWPPYWAHRDRLDQGTLSVVDYWSTIADELGVVWRPAIVQSLWAADFRSWISVEPATVDILADLHDGGTRMALLSNAGFDFVSAFTYAPMGSYFERIFVSAELDSIKPDPAIYLEVAGELGITPEQMVFIDNKSVNTDAAAALGITTHHFEGAADLRVFLEGLTHDDAGAKATID
jgi:putative hydrolase of the HAD superfamily